MRRFPAFAAAALATLTLLSLPAHAATVAYTFDDGPILHPGPGPLSAQQRNQAMLDALARHHVKSVLFVTAGNGAKEAAGYALAKAWGDAGHLVANHTVSHPDLHRESVSLARYQQEVLDCDAVIRGLPNYRKWYRYTYLNEGNTPAKREGMRAFLRQQGYAPAPVTFNVADWVVADKLEALLRADPHADVEAIKQAYLADVRKQAAASLAAPDAPKDGVHILLLHHNLPNALWLDELIGVLESMGLQSTPAGDVLARLRP